MNSLLLIVNSPDFYLSHWQGIARFLIRSGWVVHVATAETTELARNRICEHGVYYHRISIMRGGIRPLAELRTVSELRRLILQIQPSIVHAITIKPVIYVGIISRLLGVPALLAVTGLGYSFLAKGFKGVVLRSLAMTMYRIALSGKCKRVVFENNADRSKFISLGLVAKASTRLIGGAGVDTELFKFWPEPSSPLVLFASRLLSDKGIYEFVTAIRHLKDRFPHVKFVLAGAIDEMNPAAVQKETIDHWVADGLVEYWGDLRNMEQVIPKASIVVLPSYREGFPRVLQEAAACGRPVVTTDVPGCRDAIITGVTGLLVPVRNAEALAEAVSVLLLDSAKRKSLGLSARTLAEESFRIQDIAAEYHGLYQELINCI